MTLKATKKDPGSNKDPEYIFDQDYMKKMLQFHRKVNEIETLLGVYISSTVIDKQAMVIVHYFMNLYSTKQVRSHLQIPLVLLFDPELGNNKLEIKVSKSNALI